MALTWAQVSDMAKLEYLPVMIDHITLEDFAMKYIRKMKKVENVNYEFVKSFRMSFSEGTKMMRDVTEPLAQPGQRSYKKFVGTTKWRNGVIKIYEPIAQLMKKDEKAFIDELSQEISGIADAMKAEQERMAYGDGGITPLAKCAATATTSTASPLLISCTSTKLLRPGMFIDFLDSSHQPIANGTGLEIEDIVDDNSFTVRVKVTGTDLNTLKTALNNALIYHQDGYMNETYGFMSLFGSATNTIFGIDRSQTSGAWFRPQVKRIGSNGLENGAATGTSKDWELKDLDQALKILTIQKKANKNELKIFTTPGIESYAIQLRQQMGEVMAPRKSIDLWPYEVIEFNGVPMLVGNLVPDNTMFIPDMSGFVLFEAMKLQFSDMDGNMWKWDNGYAAYVAFLLEAYELGHYTPWKCMTIFDMAQSY